MERPAALFGTIADGIAAAGRASGSRVMVEKPFGHDLASAQALNSTMHQHFSEDDIYRVDHWLGLDPVEIIAVLAVIAVAWLVRADLEGWAFAATTLAMATVVLSIFSELYPKVMVSSTNPAYSLTIHNSASGSYSLTVMTIVVAIFLPFVLAYTAWTYYVFRRRVSDKDFRIQQTAH